MPALGFVQTFALTSTQRKPCSAALAAKDHFRPTEPGSRAPSACDPYAQVATMCRSVSSSHKSSWSDGLHGVTTSLHSFRHQEPLSCPRQRLVISCVRRWPGSSHDCSSALNSRQAPQILAFQPVDRNCHPSGSRILSRATTGHGDRTLRREPSCARKLCRGLVVHERAQAAPHLHKVATCA